MAGHISSEAMDRDPLYGCSAPAIQSPTPQYSQANNLRSLISTRYNYQYFNWPLLEKELKFCQAPWENYFKHYELTIERNKKKIFLF